VSTSYCAAVECAEADLIHEHIMIDLVTAGGDAQDSPRNRCVNYAYHALPQADAKHLRNIGL